MEGSGSPYIDRCESYEWLELWWELYGYITSSLGLKILGTWFLLHKIQLQYLGP